VVPRPAVRRPLKLEALEARVVRCRRCPRLVAWREEVALTKRRAYRNETYWGKPLPAFGEVTARLVVVGLAPAAHGGNRTGRMFTGDRSGDWLYASLHAHGFANQPQSVARDDGLQLIDAFITAGARCAPPDNKPTREEFANCRPWLVAELALLTRMQVVVALGALAWTEFLLGWKAHAGDLPRPLPKFGHGAEARLGAVTLLGSYHPSQQNTSTGRLTRPMLDGVFARARELLG
jgi:uracil-DNA glycosylase family 4